MILLDLAMKRNLLIVSLAGTLLASRKSASIAALDSDCSRRRQDRKALGGFSSSRALVDARGYLLFSDIPANAISMKWTPGQPSVFLKPSGFNGTGAPAGAFIGSNGLTLDKQGRLLSASMAMGNSCARERRQAHGAGGKIRRQTSEQPERCRGEIRWLDLFH
jgi:hypothetical protein